MAFFSKALNSIRKRTPSIVSNGFDEVEELFENPKETLADLLGENNLYEDPSTQLESNNQNLREQTLAAIRRKRRQLSRRRGTLSTILAGAYGLLNPSSKTQNTP